MSLSNSSQDRPKHARGVSAWGGPLYCDWNVVDFIDSWLRMSWAQCLIGLLLNETGDTAGGYLCRVTCIEKSRDLKHGSWIKKNTYAGTIPIEAEMHTPLELSKLNPDSVFTVQKQRLTLQVTAEARETADGFEMLRFAVSPTTVECVELAARYSARTEPYVWLPCAHKH